MIHGGIHQGMGWRAINHPPQPDARRPLSPVLPSFLPSFSARRQSRSIGGADIMPVLEIHSVIMEISPNGRRCHGSLAYRFMTERRGIFKT